MAAEVRGAPAAGGVELRALGPVEAVVGGRLVDLGPPKQCALFALLVSRVGRPVAVDVLLEELWAGAPPPAAMTSLHAYVANLRRVLEPDRPPRAPATVLRTRAPGYLLDSRGVDVDVHRFSGHATVGWEAWGRGDPQRALSEFEAGLVLWRGEAYAEVADAAWVMPEVARLEELRLSVVEGRCAALLALGVHEVAVAELEAHVQAHPLREHGCELLALALYRAGRQADALAVLRATRTRLAEELGIDPGAALQRLERDILIQAPVLDWHPPTAPRPVAAAVETVSSTGPAPVEEQDIFIGRQAALRRLADAVARAAGGRGWVVLVAGEPGVGKTSLLRRFAELAGVPVVWGSCSEHVAVPPLWPWEKVLRAVRTRCPERPVPGPVAELLDGQGPELAEGSDVAGAALRRFQAIGQYLAAGPEPLVVVLDDVHWTDLASLRLLAYLADTITTSRLLLVASYRGHETAALAEMLAALARAGAGRIELTGLDAEDTQALVSAVTGREVSMHTATRLWARTEGNPFFLRELIGLLTSEHRLDQPEVSPVPVPVREVVLRRIARLPQATAEVLSVAAIAGRDFDVDVVAEAASVEVEAALEAIDAAVAAGLVVEDQQRLGWFGFTHALVAEALYEATGRLRRVRRHRRIGAAAARVWAGHTEHAAEIARHWLLAAELDPATAAQASAYAATAARVADARLAPDDAAESWRQALAAAELAGDVDRYPLVMGLATSLYRAGNPRDGLPVFVQAMEHALAQDDPHGADIPRLVTTVVAAIGESGWYPVVGSVDDERLIDVLQQALLRLTDPVQQALLLSLLAVARYYDDNPARRVTLSDLALALARPAADTVALARVLHLRAMALSGPDYPEQCLAAATELLGLPGLPPPMVAAARLLRVSMLTAVGRITAVAAELDLVVPLVEQSGSPIYRMRLGWNRAGLLLLAGRWPEADAISRATYNLHSGMSYGVDKSVAQAVRMFQRWEAAYLAGTGADLVDELRAAVEATGAPTLRGILTMALVEAGRLEDARAVLRFLAPGPKNYRWLYMRCWGLLAAARLGETEHVTRLRDQLLPYRRLPCAVFATAVSGSVAYFTGEAALALGDPDAALADLTIAVEVDKTMGALPWLAQARDAITRAQRCAGSGR